MFRAANFGLASCAHLEDPSVFVWKGKSAQLGLPSQREYHCMSSIEKEVEEQAHAMELAMHLLLEPLGENHDCGKVSECKRSDDCQ